MVRQTSLASAHFFGGLQTFWCFSNLVFSIFFFFSFSFPLVLCFHTGNMFSYLLRMYSEFGESPRVAMSGEMVSLAGIEKNEEEWVFSEKSPLPASSPIQTKKKKRRKSHRPRSHSCSSDTVSKEVTWGNVEEVWMNSFLFLFLPQ